MDHFSSLEFTGRRLRIALFSGNYNYTADGANQTLNRLVGHLEQVEGAQVRVYSPTSATPAFPPQGELVSTPSFQAPFRPDYRVSLGLSPRIERDIAAFAPDVIHLSAPDPLGFGAQGLARRRGTPVVASVHTLFETYLRYYGLEWARPLVEGRLRDFYRNCDHILAPTPELARQLADDGVGARIQVWGRGVDRNLFDPGRRRLAWRRARGIADEATVVVFVGRLVMEKGLAVFADAAERVMASDPDVRVLVIGDGPKRGWLQSRLPGADFTGFLTSPELNIAMASSDILLNPSCTESFCNVTLEAMASGLAIVAADAPNHRLLIRSEVVGRLVAPDDATGFARTVLALARAPAVRRSMGLAARVESARYDWRDILAAAAAVYRTAAAAPAGSVVRKAPKSLVRGEAAAH